MVRSQNEMMNKMKRKSPGFTLTEVLIAVTLTLVLLGLMIRIFAISGSEIAKGRSLLELAGQLRSTAELLRSDLKGITVRMVPRNQIGGAAGYFEYIEGVSSDRFIHTFQNGNPDTSAIYGDIDDIVMFTARAQGQPFRGRFGGQIIESDFAEIIWWTVFIDENGNGQFNVGEELKLYRRVLLIRPDLATTVTDVGEFLQFNDVSVRLDPTNTIVMNSLSDLSDRANRFARAGEAFPRQPNSFHEPLYAALQGSNAFVLTNPTALGSDNLGEGEDVMLSGIIGFDVQAFDPVVEIQQSPDFSVGLTPGDFGYDSLSADTTNIQFGGYVDLNTDGRHGTTSNGIFTNAPGFPAPDDPSIVWFNPTYCTWSLHYESDGIDQDNDWVDDNGDSTLQTNETGVDEGSNQLDDDNANGPDDLIEYETQPPYPYPLRGVRITIRLLEPTNQVIRQTSVIHNFVPE